MKAWGVWVWPYSGCREDGWWKHEAKGLVPYVFYHYGPAFILAENVVEARICTAMPYEFAEDGMPIFTDDADGEKPRQPVKGGMTWANYEI